MSEILQPIEATGFVAPDEGQLIDDPGLAEDMARSSHSNRSKAASLSKDKAIMETIGANTGTIEYTDLEAKKRDEAAEWQEFLEPISQEHRQKAQEMSVLELNRARHVMKDKRKEMVGRLHWVDTVGATDTNAIDQQKKELQHEIGVNDAIDRIYRQQLETLGQRPEY